MNSSGLHLCSTFLNKIKNSFYNPLDITFILRSMLFSFPVHVAAFSSIGFSAKAVIGLEGVFLIGVSATQLLGGIINDATSPRLAFGIGKFITAIACMMIALFHGNIDMNIMFFLWGAGVGLYDGSDLLSVNPGEKNWQSLLKHVESLGIYGSLLSFIIGSLIFQFLGFKMLFIANAIVALLIPIILIINNKNDNNSNEKNVLNNEKKFNLSLWFSSIYSAPFIAIIGYSAATIALKVSIIELQHQLFSIGINVFWNGWIFVGFTLIVYYVIRLQTYYIGYLIIFFSLILVICWKLGSSGLFLTLTLSLLALLIRASHKILFFANLAEKSNQLTIGRDSSLAQVLSGIFLLIGTKTFSSSKVILICSISFCMLAFCVHKIRKVNE